jgi:hypothetical protein
VFKNFCKTQGSNNKAKFNARIFITNHQTRPPQYQDLDQPHQQLAKNYILNYKKRKDLAKATNPFR